jgi:ABC-type polysaccharide/polyol phosphate export permease
VALVIALPFFDVGISINALWAIPLLVLLVLITTAVTLFASCANVFFRDAKHLVQIVLSFGIFFTPVFFEADAFGPTGAKIAMLNPLAPTLEGLRLAIVSGHNLLEPLTTAAGTLVWSPAYLAYATIWGVLGILGSVLLFHRAQFLFAEYV